jgi:nitrate/nitrite-specific signal transduction histidine kinase
LENPRTSAAVAATPAARPAPRGRGGLAGSLLRVILPLSLLPFVLFAVLVLLNVELNIAVAVAAVALVIGLLGIILATRRATAPLQSLADAASGLASGEMTAPLSAGQPGEVGQLAGAFNHLSAELRGVYDSLDSRVEARTRQLATAAEIGRASASILTAEDLLARSAELIRDRLGYDHVLIFLLDESARSVVLSEAAGPAAESLKATGLRFALDSTSLLGWVASNRQPHAARRVDYDELFTPIDLLPDTRSEAGLPLRVGDRLIGVVAAHSRVPNAFDASELEVLQSLADQIAVALENGRLFTRQERVARLEQQVAALTTRLHASLTLDAILENAAQDLGRVFGASKVVVRLNPEAEGLLSAHSAVKAGALAEAAPPSNGHTAAPNGHDHSAEAETGPSA